MVTLLISLDARRVRVTKPLVNVRPFVICTVNTAIRGYVDRPYRENFDKLGTQIFPKTHG